MNGSEDLPSYVSSRRVVLCILKHSTEFLLLNEVAQNLQVTSEPLSELLFFWPAPRVNPREG